VHEKDIGRVRLYLFFRQGTDRIAKRIMLLAQHARVRPGRIPRPRGDVRDLEVSNGSAPACTGRRP
jgi:hypothetical protein